MDRVSVTERDGATLASGDTINGAYILDVALTGEEAGVEFQHSGGHVREMLPFVAAGK